MYFVCCVRLYRRWSSSRLYYLSKIMSTDGLSLFRYFVLLFQGYYYFYSKGQFNIFLWIQETNSTYWRTLVYFRVSRPRSQLQTESKLNQPWCINPGSAKGKKVIIDVIQEIAELYFKKSVHYSTVWLQILPLDPLATFSKFVTIQNWDFNWSKELRCMR